MNNVTLLGVTNTRRSVNIMNNNLRIIREKKGLSQLALSRISGVPGNVISNLELGKVYPYPGWRKKLSQALELPEEEVFPD